MKRLTAQLSYANVVATLALIIAVGTGGAYAASKIGASDLKRITQRAGPVQQIQSAEFVTRATAQCRKNERLLRGGYAVGGAMDNVTIQDTGLNDGPRMHRVNAKLRAPSPRAQFRAVAYCLRR